MRLYWLELKRILKTRTTWIILAALLMISALFGYLPSTFVYHAYLGPNGEKIEISGTEAIRLRREAQSLYAGDLTVEKMQAVLATYQSVTAQYGDYYGEDFPYKVYLESILPIAPLLHIFKEAYADSKTGLAADLMTLTADDVEDFYPALQKHFADLMGMEQSKYPAIQAKAIGMYGSAGTLLTYMPGYNPDAMDYVTLFLLIFVLAMAVLCAPIFSAEYQTQSDDILRITKHGQVRLAMTKLAAALTILLVTFALCTTILCVVSDALFGRECLKTSIRVQYTAAALADIDLHSMLMRIIFEGLMTLLATGACTLYISTKCRTTASALICALLMCLLPIIMFYMLNGNLANWLRCLLPSGGIGLGNSYQYELIDMGFLRLGKTGFWTPQVLLVAAIIETPLFLGLSVRSYCRHAA